MTTVSYTGSTPYLGNRPWADVVLNPGSGAPVLKCLVDTGADYLQINAADARAAGVPVTGHPTLVSTVAGSASLQLVSGVSVSIEGSAAVVVDVLVDPTNSTRPVLAGRQLLLAAFEIGFDVSQWLRV